MHVLQTNSFKKAVKKLYLHQKRALDEEVKKIMKDPCIGDEKKGDLLGVYVHKFSLDTQLYLLAYTYEATIITLTLLALGSHENFYRDLKRKR